MKKTYNNAELQIVRLNKRDIVTASDMVSFDGTIFDGTADAPGMRDFNDWGHIY